VYVVVYRGLSQEQYNTHTMDATSVFRMITSVCVCECVGACVCCVRVFMCDQTTENREIVVD